MIHTRKHHLATPLGAVHHVIHHRLLTNCRLWCGWLRCGGDVTHPALLTRHHLHIINGNVSESRYGVRGGENNLKVRFHFINGDCVLYPLFSLFARNLKLGISINKKGFSINLNEFFYSVCVFAFIILVSK